MDDRDRLDLLTRKIIGAAIEVHGVPGPGLLESAYEACLAFELSQLGLSVQRQLPLPVHYKDVKLDCGYRLDLLVEDTVVVEIEALEQLAPIHQAQVLSYLRLSGKQIGLLINFNSRVLKQGLKRIVNRFPDSALSACSAVNSKAPESPIASANTSTAVLLLAHGTADSLDDIPEFLRHVTGGRPVPPQIIDEVRHRYSLIGHSPMNEITARQGELLARELGLPVYVAMRNWKPFIPDVVKAVAADGFQRVIAICLAPQNSRTSVGLYRKAVEGDSGPPFALEFVESWHDHPLLVNAFAEKLRAGWEPICRETNTRITVIFTAHSVPQRTIAEGDPYETQARETAALVATKADLLETDWTFAFQSQGMSSGAWLGPTVEDTILHLKAQGHTGVFVQPIGFLCDHVEVLYDIDVGFRDFATKHGMRLWRAESLNDSPTLIAALADIARNRGTTT